VCVDCAKAKQGVCVAGLCICINGFTGLDCSVAPTTTTPLAVTTAVTATVVSTPSNTVKVNATSTANGARFAEVNTAAAEGAESLVDGASVHAEISSQISSSPSYVVPMPPAALGILSFSLGVAVAFGGKFILEKREEQIRKQKMLKPLLSTR